MTLTNNALRPAAAYEPHRQKLCIIVRGEVLPDESETVAELLQDLADDIRSDEPGCLAYSVTRALGSPTHFAVHAQFAGWRGFQRHALTPHMKRTMPLLKRKLASRISIEIFQEI